MAEGRGLSVIRSGDGSVLIGPVFMKDGAGAKITSGSGTYRLYHINPATGNIDTGYDFGVALAFSAAPVTPTSAMTHQALNGFNTGLWHARFTDLTHLVVGDKYVIFVEHASLPAPSVIPLVIQYGDSEGDLQMFAEADFVFENATGYFMHIYKKGTTTDLTTKKKLLDTSGAQITVAGTPVASQAQ